MTSRPALASVLLLALAAETAAAQLAEPLHFDNAPRWYDIDATSFPLPEANEMAVFDVDGDGDEDIVRVLAAGQSMEVGANVDGRFELHSSVDLLFGNGMLGTDVKPGDFDGDGVTDVVVAGKQTTFPYPGVTRVFLGNGAGAFVAQTPSVLLPPDPFFVQVAAADVDQDGRSDVIAYDSGDGTTMINRSAGPTGAIAFGGHVTGLDVADLTGDGFPELVAVVHGSTPATGEILIAFNDGAGGYPAPPVGLGVIAGPWALEVEDLDGDGMLDLVTTVTDSNPAASFVDVAVYRGTGAGAFATPVISPLLGPFWSAWDIEVEDLDGDDRPDLVIAFETAKAGTWGLLSTARNEGNLKFGLDRSVAVRTRDVAVLDFDGAGGLEIIGADAHVIPVDENGHIGGTALSGPSDFGFPISQVVVDFDQDGLDDLFTLDVPAGQVDLWRAAGEGAFDAPVSFGHGQPIPKFFLLEAGDTDGDGWDDLLLVGAERIVTMKNLAGAGLGAPVVTLMPACIDRILSVAVADLNGDGFVDIVRADDKVQVGTLAFALGNGGYAVQCFTYPHVPGSVYVADVTGDGRLDLTHASRLDASYFVLPGTGSGAFGAPIQSFVSGGVASIQAMGDLDGDGDVDFVTNRPKGLAVVANDGAGGFSLMQVLSSDFTFRELHLADMDKDGDLDLLADRHLHLFLFENRDGVFVETAPKLEVRAASLFASADVHAISMGQIDFGDFDADTLPDVAFSGSVSDPAVARTTVFFNRTVLRSRGWPRSGSTVQLALHAPAAALRPFLLLASTTGTLPGVPVGGDHLPLNVDPFLWNPAALGAILVPFVGTLDAQGDAAAQLVIPGGLSIPPTPIDLAFVTTESVAPHAPLTSNRRPLVVR